MVLEVLKYERGGVYVGEMKNGLSHGHGTLFFSSGDRLVGDFKNGNCDTDKCKYYYPDGSEYDRCCVIL